jgi:hypothetical protein
MTGAKNSSKIHYEPPRSGYDLDLETLTRP